jgi:hypothetical protein
LPLKFKTIKILAIISKMSASQSNKHTENTTKEVNEFEPTVKEAHEGAPAVDDEQLKVLPENEEEKEEILSAAAVLPTTTATETVKRATI